MILIFAVDDNNGLAFNRRRQSQDRILREKILDVCKENRLWVTHHAPLTIRVELLNTYINANGIVLGLNWLRFKIDIKYDKIFIGWGSFNGNIVDMAHRHRLSDLYIAQLSNKKTRTAKKLCAFLSKKSGGFLSCLFYNMFYAL